MVAVVVAVSVAVAVIPRAEGRLPATGADVTVAVGATEVEARGGVALWTRFRPNQESIQCYICARRVGTKTTPTVWVTDLLTSGYGGA